MERNDRVLALEKLINDNAEFSLIEKLSESREFSNEPELINFLQVIVFLIERSNGAAESAATVLWKKIFTEQISKGQRSDDFYGRYIIGLIGDQAISPFVRLTYFVSRLIATIIYDRLGNETQHITRVLSKADLLQFNEYFLSKYIKINPLDHNTMSLFYNCVSDIDINDSRVKLSDKSCKMMYNHIIDGNLENYLKIFLRPYFSSVSTNWMPEARYHVPEPFYLQIFGEGELEKIILPLTNIGKTRNLANDILEFMIKYNFNKSRNIDWVDIGKIFLHKDLHKNLRTEE